MTDAELVEVLLPLVVSDPWSWSREGSDDCCLFCGCDHTTMVHTVATGIRWVRHHHSNCAWVLAMAALGREHPEQPADQAPSA